MSTTKSRRAFLLASAAGISAAWAAAENDPRLVFFSETQAAEIEAMAAQIIPADESPGAREAHCVYFIDRALAGFAKSSQPVYLQGLQDLQTQTRQLFPDAGKFSALTSEQQIKVLTAIEKTSFFRTVRTHTVIGFFSRPVHGGNYGEAGWKLIGYEDSLNHKPPFGYYDAEEARR